MNIRLGELKTVFDDLEVIFNQMEIDFYLIGALAKEVWYTALAIAKSHQGCRFRSFYSF